MKNNAFLIAALTATSVLMSACVVTPDPYYNQPVRVAPPPMRQEYPGYPPVADYLWVSGYWGWGGARYEWVPGRWEAPRQGHVWVPHRWERDGDHWRQSGGRWEQDNHPRPMPRAEPQPIPRQERDNPPPRREWGGEPRAVQPVERDNRSRYEQRDNGRPAEANPAYRTERANAPRPEARPAPAAAPAPVPAPPPAQVKGEDKSRGERKDEARAKRRERGDER